MANLAKYAAAAAKPLIRHVVRQHKNYRNKNIDPTLTGCNYSLCPDRGSSVRYYNRVLQDVHHINRDNVVTLCSWTVSLPSELKKATEEQEREFFKTAYDFVLNRYFGNNEKFVVAAEVHNDEVYREVQTDRWTGAPIIGENGKAVLSFEARTPHLQILFVPAIEDGKHGGYKLCRAPEEYSVGEILECTEGSLSAVACLASGAEPCPRASACQTLPIWAEYDKLTHDFFFHKKLSDVANVTTV